MRLAKFSWANTARVDCVIGYNSASRPTTERPLENESQTVPETTNVGTLRPDKAATRTEGTEFSPLAQPNWLVRSTLTTNLIYFKFLFLNEQLQILVENINKNEHKARIKQGAPGGGTDRGGREVRGWLDTNVKELYAYFGVGVYEGVHPEPRITDYWQVNKD